MGFIKLIKSIFDRFSSIYQFKIFCNEWRKLNAHNSTIPISIFPIKMVSVGYRSYGNINIESYENINEQLIIGNYVSIANQVTFILGGNHQTKTITSYPFYSRFIELSPEKDAQTKGPIIIEDEVWIGFGVIILSGVRVGKGAIIGAGSVVTKDIPAYAIVGGNPAKIIKYRFNEELCMALHDFKIIDFDDSLIVENINEFYKSLDIDQLNKLKQLKVRYTKD